MFSYNIINEAASTMVIPEGDLSYDVCHDLKAVVSSLMTPGTDLAFNMEKVSFLDSSGIGLLVHIRNLAEQRNGTFAMHHLQKNVKSVLDKLSLNEFLNVSECGIKCCQ